MARIVAPHKVAGLCGHLDGLAAALAQLVPLAFGDGQTDAIHDARVATRRLQTTVNLLRPELPRRRRKRFVRLLRKVRRRLRSVRDLDVMGEHLQSLGRQRGYENAAKWVQAQLAERHDAAITKLRRRRLHQDLPAKLGRAWRKLRPHVGPVEPALVATLLTQSLSAQLGQFATHARQLIHARGQTSGDAQATTPHLLRIAAKRLRYTLEIAENLGWPGAADAVLQIKRVQQVLGLWHDQVVLSAAASSLSAEQPLAYRDLGLQQQVLALSQLALRNAAKQWQAFEQLWQAEGATFGRIIGRHPAAEHAPSLEPADDRPWQLDVPAALIQGPDDAPSSDLNQRPVTQ